jgi:hypothetical protein
MSNETNAAKAEAIISGAIAAANECTPPYVIGLAETLTNAIRAQAAALDSHARQIEALTQDMTEARAEIVECDALRADMASILRAVAIAVRGPEADGISWGWSDLPDRVTAAVNMMSGAVELAREHAATIEALTAERDKREAEFMAMLAAEHQVSAGYVALRGILGAMNPPGAGWESLSKYVEGVARSVVTERDELRKRLEDAKPATPAPGEWVEWHGGDVAPVADGVWIQIRSRNGSGIFEPECMASLRRWTHGGGELGLPEFDIVAYRILP